MAKQVAIVAALCVVLALASVSEARLSWSWKGLVGGAPATRRALRSTCECYDQSGLTCGSDGKLYASACDANCDGHHAAYPGFCKPEACSPCDNSPFFPVCVGGFTYAHGCYAACSGADLRDLTYGACSDKPEEGEDGDDNLDLPEDSAAPEVSTGSGSGSGSGESCICSEEYKPVCGSDGTTHSNACKAACAGVDVRHEGECDLAPGEDPEEELSGCDLCWDEWIPVCGVDGQTYDNECKATCQGIEVAHEDVCKK